MSYSIEIGLKTKTIYQGHFTLNHLFQLKDKNILLLMDFHQVKDF
jgi:hypothetical protein